VNPIAVSEPGGGRSVVTCAPGHRDGFGREAEPIRPAAAWQGGHRTSNYPSRSIVFPIKNPGLRFQHTYYQQFSYFKLDWPNFINMVV
jgi:hypothetical protein